MAPSVAPSQILFHNIKNIYFFKRYENIQESFLNYILHTANIVAIYYLSESDLSQHALRRTEQSRHVASNLHHRVRNYRHTQPNMHT